MNQAGLAHWIWTTLAATLGLVSPASAAAPYPQSAVVSDVQFDWTKHIRRAQGSDNWAMTWASNDHQYTSWGDGFGFDGGTTKKSLGYSRIEGSSTSWTGDDVFGSENAEAIANLGGKSYAILAVNGVLYSFVSPGSDTQNLTTATLYKSTDGGHSWNLTPVVFTETLHGLALPCFLQFGRDYAGARDSYVYAYWTKVKSHVWEVQKPGEIILTRVPKTSIEDPLKYEYFAGLGSGGSPTWSLSLTSMVPVFQDPNGVMRNSVNYNAGLGRYLLVTNHTTKNLGNVAIFDAPEPWGPWTTIRYFTGWPAGGEVSRNTFYGNFSSKWFSSSGLDFVFVFTGKDTNDSWNSVPGRFILPGATDATPPDPPADLRANP